MAGGTDKNIQMKQPEKRPKSRGTKLLSASLLNAQKVYGGNVSGGNIGISFTRAAPITTETPSSSAQRRTYQPAPVYASVPVARGGYQYIYTGNVETTKKEQKRSVSRLSAYNPERVPDSKRIMSPEHKEKGGKCSELSVDRGWTSLAWICVM